jgi:Immunity protein 49
LQRYTSLYYEFIEKDLTKVKQAFYQFGRISEFCLKKYDSDVLSYSGLFTFSHIILSDNLPLIKRFADFKPIKYNGKEYIKDIERGRLTHMGILQSIIKEDWQECKHLIEILKVKNKQFKLDVSFYEYLINGDTKNIESVLKKFVSKPVHNRRNSGLLGEFISYPAVGYAKLAWNMGINVEINSPLIPKDWLPIQPLKDEEYIDYDFVKDYFNS